MSFIIKDENGHNQVFEVVGSTEIRLKRRTNLIANAMKLKENANACEVGSGTGEMSYWLAKDYPTMNITGIDVSKGFVELSKQKYQLPNLKYELIDFTEPNEFQNNQFDYLFGNGILHHLYYHLDDTLEKFKKITKSNGKIIFMEPNIYNPYVAVIFKIPYFRKKANLEPDEMAFSENFIRKKLEAHGYKNIKIKYKDFLLPGVSSFMIKPLITIGAILEKIPILKLTSQSIFIEAEIS